jgi:hypothetical protein
LLAFPLANLAAAAGPAAFFQTRGVVLTPDDFSLTDWPQRVSRAGLTTIGLHHGVSPQKVVDFIQSDQGRRFLEDCRRLSLQVEYELHAVKELLPRSLFSKDKNLFRMDDKGERTADFNLCVSSPAALEIAAERALEIGRKLRPTSQRYFFWGDDGVPWCRCSECRDLSDSDQALIFENHLLQALRQAWPEARLAHLAYSNTLAPPRKIKPAPGVFLEYAPIKRRYDLPYERQTGTDSADQLGMLDANLAWFGAAEAQVLEYWLDVSRFSGWRRPAVKLPWNKEVFAQDLNTYGRRGIRHITSFAVFIDADYIARHGEPPLEKYGALLKAWPSAASA